MALGGRPLLIALIALGAVIRLVTAAVSYGDGFDMESYRIVGDALRDGTPFDTYDQISDGDFTRAPYAPGYWPVVAVVAWLEDRFGLALDFVIQLVPIAADCALAFLVWRYLGERGMGDRSRLIAAGLVALGPSIAFVSAYHGHFDAVAILPAVAALILWERPSFRRRALAAGLLIGLGAAIKTMPLLMLLALLPTARSLREALVLCTAAVAVPVLMLLPFALSAPSGIGLIVTYEGVGGFGGISLLAQPELADIFIRGTEIDGFNGATSFLLDFGSWLLLAALGALGLLMLRRRTPAHQAAVAVWLTVYVLGYGFAHHYLVWGVPFFLMAGYLWQTALLQAALLVPRVIFAAVPFGHVGWTVLYATLMVLVWLGMLVALAGVTRRIAAGRPAPVPAYG